MSNETIKVSATIEDMVHEVKLKNDQLDNKDAIIKILAGFVFDYLDVFESKFESNESEFTYDQMWRYVQSATYIQQRFGRKGMQRRVLERMNDLNF